MAVMLLFFSLLSTVSTKLKPVVDAFSANRAKSVSVDMGVLGSTSSHQSQNLCCRLEIFKQENKGVVIDKSPERQF